RLLIRSPLNPYRLPEDVTAALRAPTSRAEFDAALAGLYRPSGGSHLRQLGSVLPPFLLRLALSLCLSYIVATFVLFVVFAPEIQQRAVYLNDQIQSQLIKETNAKYDLREARIKQELRALPSANPGAAQASGRVTNL